MQQNDSNKVGNIHKIVPPRQAVTAGYTQLKFFDDFELAQTIDVEQTCKAGYLWYTDRPFKWADVPACDYTVSNSQLCLHTGNSHAGWGLSSYSCRGKIGHAFRYGYFEARIRFDPTLGETSGYFPCWWSFSVEHCLTENSHWGELDFFEAYTSNKGKQAYTGEYCGTVHDWIRDADGIARNHQNPNNWQVDRVKDDGWHIYGCLWEPGTVRWFMDDVFLMEQKYSAAGAPIPAAIPDSLDGCYSILDSEQMLLVLGSSEDWPMYVDWVRVWQE